jgi:uncharacterized membrane protein
MGARTDKETKDRLRGEHDYKINLKAELEIRHLHQKADFLLKQQSQHLFEIQQVWMELVEDVVKQRGGK